MTTLPSISGVYKITNFKNGKIYKWTIGWKPIGAKGLPKWSDVRFDTFADANRAVAVLKLAYPESRYFVATINWHRN